MTDLHEIHQEQRMKIFSAQVDGQEVFKIVAVDLADAQSGVDEDLVDDVTLVELPEGTLVHTSECPAANGEEAKGCFCGVCDGRLDWCDKCQRGVPKGSKHPWHGV